MLSQEVIEKLSAIFVRRAEEVNTFTLRAIARQLKKIKEFEDLRPTEINKLVNLLKYGGDYNKIEKQLAKLAKRSQKDIEKIFEETAKKNQYFAKKFYDYRNIKYIPFEQNSALKQQVEAIADITKNTYTNIGNTRAIGFSMKVGKHKKFVPLKKVYTDCIDRSIISLSQGQTTLGEEIKNIVKELSSSGLKVVEFESGYSRRLDSQVSMNLQDGLSQLQQQINLTFGEEFGADGVEVTAHYNPAPDHEEVQGRQFTNEEFYKFQNDEDAIDVKGKKFPKDFNGHDRRSIGQYYCKHKVYPIIVGVEDPVYSDEELQKIIDENEKGIELDGKHYTNYEAIQLIRKLETEIRKTKEEQIMFVEVDDQEGIQESQKRIRLLNKKLKRVYNLMNEPMDYSGTYVDGYKYVSTSN